MLGCCVKYNNEDDGNDDDSDDGDDDDGDDVTSQVALARRALLFHKSKGILHGTLYSD